MRYPGEEILTTSEGRNAYQRRDGKYYYRITPNVSPVVAKLPRGVSLMQGEHLGAPITDYNNWPQDISNVSIFHYLLPHSPAHRYAEFYDFVKHCYKCSCAIIYEPSQAECQIIGTGCLIRENIVATARHVFQDVLNGRLFVRFFDYDVSAASQNMLLIREHYLDIPVVNVQLAAGGLDAGCLQLAIPCDKSILQKYTRILPIDCYSLSQCIPEGSYAMFHFAGGSHQVSVGKIEQTPYGVMQLNDEIEIQAGSGASGATIIRKSFEDIRGYGISIYRVMKDGWMERRLIAFRQFNKPGFMVDPIIAPYRSNPSFFVIPPGLFSGNGYEFIQWRDITYHGERVDKPEHPEYAVSPYAHHHITPIFNLLYLWDYLHRLDERTRVELRRSVHDEIRGRQLRIEHDYNRETREFNRRQTLDGDEYRYRWTHRAKRARDEDRVTLKRKIASERIRQYGHFDPILAVLCQPNQCNRGTFAWSWWNIFAGWPHRSDDPKNRGDRSEQNPPHSFPVNLWVLVRRLHETIERLKLIDRDINLEIELFEVLNQLSHLWKITEEKHIHQFHPEDWVEDGRRNGHRLYKLWR